jgi:hypothetical protein
MREKKQYIWRRNNLPDLRAEKSFVEEGSVDAIKDRN